MLVKGASGINPTMLYKCPHPFRHQSISSPRIRGKKTHIYILRYCSTLTWPGNFANPVYDVTTICHQVRWLRWGHPSLFHTATSLLIWYKMFCVRDISYRLIWMEFINMFSVYAQYGTNSRFNWCITVVLTYNPSVLMYVEITDAPKL